MIFPCNFNDIGYSKFLITLCCYVYNFENTIGHYIYNINSLLLFVKFYEIQHKIKEQIGSIISISPKLNGDRCMWLFSSIIVCYVKTEKYK